MPPVQLWQPKFLPRFFAKKRANIIALQTIPMIRNMVITGIRNSLKSGFDLFTGCRFHMGRKSIVMKADLGYVDCRADNLIHNSVLIRNSTRPKASVIVFQWLRLTYSCVGTSCYILDQLVDLFQDFFICLLPINIFFPRPGRKTNVHLSTKSLSFFFTTFPCFSSAIDSFNRRAFAGVRVR